MKNKTWHQALEEIVRAMERGGMDREEAYRLMRNWTTRVERRQERYLAHKNAEESRS